MTREQAFGDFEADVAYLAKKRANAAPGIGAAATNLALSPFFSLGVPEASYPRIEFDKPINPIPSRDLGETALNNLIIVDFTTPRPTPGRAAERALKRTA